MITHTFELANGDWKFVFLRTSTDEVIVRVAQKGKYCSGLVSDVFTERGGTITKRDPTDYSILEFVDREGLTVGSIGGGRMIVSETDRTITCAGPSTTYHAPPAELLEEWLMDVINKDPHHRPWKLDVSRMGYGRK